MPSLGAAVLVFVAGCQSKPPPPPPCVVCAQAKLLNQWCDHCKVGYVAGVPIKSKILFESMDAHGHDLVLRTFTCPTCKAAIANEGFCEKCRIGWVKKKAYFSRLTYHLAHGTSCDPSTITCPVCRKNSEKYGWCDACKQGMVGNVVVKNRSDFDGGRRGYDLMMCAIEASKRCETCALVILTDTSCFFCKIAYKDGHPVQRAAPQAPPVASSNKRPG